MGLFAILFFPSNLLTRLAYYHKVQLSITTFVQSYCSLKTFNEAEILNLN